MKYIKLIVYEVIKNRQNNHIILLYFYSKEKNNFSETYHFLFNMMLINVTNLTLKIRKHIFFN